MVLDGNQGEPSPGLSQLATVQTGAPFLFQTSGYVQWVLWSMPACNFAILPLLAEEHSSITKAF